MDSTLVSFVRALRSAGAEPSTCETIDAARAVALVGYGDRAELKAALGMALAKSDEEKRIRTRFLTSTLRRCRKFVRRRQPTRNIRNV